MRRLDAVSRTGRRRLYPGWRHVLQQAGFTLIELLVVIIVLGLLVGLVGPRLFQNVGKSKQAAAKAQIELFGAALDQYRLDVGSYPNTSQGLEALQKNPNVAGFIDTLGWVYYRRNLPALAVPPLLKAVKAEPRNAEFLYHLGAAYAAAGDKVKARNLLTQALELKLGANEAKHARELLDSLRS